MYLKLLININGLSEVPFKDVFYLLIMNMDVQVPFVIISLTKLKSHFDYCINENFAFFQIVNFCTIFL